jgi:hypothetical protein
MDAEPVVAGRRHWYYRNAVQILLTAGMGDDPIGPRAGVVYFWLSCRIATGLIHDRIPGIANCGSPTR